MKKYLELIRFKHYIKNLLIFIPMVTAHILTTQNLIITSLGYLSFSFLTSFVYIINDIKDIEKDKLHPRKKNRPLPSGKIKKSTAIFIAIIMLILSISINTIITKTIFSETLFLLIWYLIINLLYSFGLKDIAIIDILILSLGFIIRVYYGAALVNVEVSDWLFLTILNASLFLGLGKRKKEIVQNKKSRKVLEEYNESFLDKFQYLCLGLTLVFYSLWAIAQDIKYLTISIPVIMVIFMRYCLKIESSDEGDPTTILYHDKFLLLLCILYAILMLILVVL